MNKYFKRSEFACKDNCGFDTVDYSLLVALIDIREHFNSPVTINSACRCQEHNKAVGGSENSQHLLGKAADIVVKGYEPHEVATYLRAKYPDTYGIGEYDEQGFVHIDVRKEKVRWN